MDRHRPRQSRSAILVAALALIACNGSPRVTLRYQLLQGLTPSEVVRVETRIAVAPGDPRTFTADLPYRAVDQGVGYEVRDFDGSGVRTLLITHDATLGYNFSDKFSFTLLPPVGDAPPLEIHARALGAGLNQVLADSGPQTATFGKAGEAQLPLADLRCGGIAACTGNETCCDGRCTDVSSATNHCGACGAACGTLGDACSGGACRCNGGSGCTTGQTCCAGLGCIDTASDAFNCGACGHACAPGETCSAGTCSCGSSTCGAGQTCCSGVCTTGGCTCNGVACQLSAPLCCGTSCTDVTNDQSNCGQCGKACASPFLCAAGKCQCNGTAVCGPTDACCGDGCKNLQTDPANCGTCGHACNQGESCVAGTCRCGAGGACGAGKLCCGDATTKACADPSTDRNNCGACGKTCASTEQCAAGACQCPGTATSCGSGQTCCPNVGCFDLSADHDHCGGCGHACGANEDCSMGTCNPSTTPCLPSCINGTSCQGGVCFCGATKTRCAGIGQLCCPSINACVDTTSDVNNCGGCNISCAAQGKDLCCAGQCQSYDDQHCGNCTTVCGGHCCTNQDPPVCSIGKLCLIPL